MKSLEGTKLFPYIAWTSIAIMVMLTASLVHDLQDSLQELDDRTMETAASLQQQ